MAAIAVVGLLYSLFTADGEWQEARAKSEADGPIVANIVSSLLHPTRFYRGFSKPSE
ncbi:hypothetical protein EV130_105312 [Rhizobium azibense]|uniref:Uncharacterized protein n=1 Tax=Rhizobium azibense TaxID=1136135 RepID=A0A4R3QVT7_9HYPH|nr:hypothetical protein EV130_105312 [Rhizobium azibense]TCU40061.1 hypothetical protein EV129_102198 [Rhizobium azibense]